jgi:Zn-finger nucleic acid-binding protein
MNCPVCGEKLREIERSGVMVDICPSCKGVWLDRGEIEKLIGAEAKEGVVIPIAAGRANQVQDDRRERGEHDDDSHDYDKDRRDDSRHREDDRSHGYSSSSRPRRSSLLSDILGGFGGD